MLQIPTDTSFNLFYEKDNYSANAVCNGHLTPGGTQLEPLGYLGLQSETGDTLSALRWHRSDNGEDPAAALLYSYSVAEANLTGNLYIDWYKAFDREVGAQCLHGADIVAYYDYGSAEERALGLTWIQLYEEAGDTATASGLVVDGVSDKTPAYYPPGYVPWKPPDYTFQAGHDLTWTDGPQDPHWERSSWQGSADFSVYLASFATPSYDAEAMVWVQQITLYDGVAWGYDGVCTPEPSTACLFALGLAALAFRCRILATRRRP